MKKTNFKLLFSAFAAVLASVVLALASPAIGAYAAPKTMPDGQVFDPEYYAANNPDVVAAFGTNEALLYQHYLICGKAEGRLPYAPAAPATTNFTLPDGSQFDPVFYAQTYPDVRAALGDNAALLYQHYIQFGQREGRLPHAVTVVSNSGVNETLAYQRLQALKILYPEGRRWDMSVGAYLYKGFSNVRYYGYECAGFAFLINDAIFGDTPDARYIYDGSHSNFHVGDILRYCHSYGEHSIVVMQVTDQGVICAEGNYNSSVHWGRLLTWGEIDRGFEYLITRYKQ